MKSIIVIFLLVSCNSVFASASQWFDLQIENGAQFLDIEIADKKAKALLGIGSQNNYIKSSFLESNDVKYKRGRPIVITGTHGQRKTHFIRGLNAKIFGIQAKFDNFAPMVNETASYDVLLGKPFFDTNIFQIDYPN